MIKRFNKLKRYLTILILIIYLSINLYAQDIFLARYNIDKQSAASLALLIYQSPIFNIEEPIKSFIENNKSFFEKLSDIYNKKLESDIDFGLDLAVSDSASASIKFKQIYSIFSNYKFDEFKLFLLDFLKLILNKNQLSVSLENFFINETKEKINFSYIPIDITTKENLFIHIKNTKNSIDHYLFFENQNINLVLFELLKYLFRERTFYTTILPKTLELNKSEQSRYLFLTGRAFIYPEAEQLLENTFILFCLNNIDKLIYKYTLISIADIINAKTFYYKTSWFNDLLKGWDQLSNDSIFKFPKPYGQVFIDFIKNDKKVELLNNFNKILELNQDIIAVVFLANDIKISDRTKNLIKLKLKKIGFYDVVFNYEMEKNINNYNDKKLIYIFIQKKDGENISPFYLKNENNNLIFQDILIKSFTEILHISYFDNINIILIVNKDSIDYFMKAIKMIPRLKDKPLVFNRNFFQKIVDKIISFFSLLSL